MNRREDRNRPQQDAAALQGHEQGREIVGPARREIREAGADHFRDKWRGEVPRRGHVPDRGEKRDACRDEVEQQPGDRFTPEEASTSG